MKIVSNLVLALCFSGACSVASAQTCSTAQVIQDGYSQPGNSCLKENLITTICGGGIPTGTIAVYTWSYDGSAPKGGTITVTPTANYDVALGVIRSTCDNSGACAQLIDAAQDGTTAEVVNTSTAQYGVAATYYLLVTSFGDGSTGATCGPFNLTVAGPLPISLQSFSVE